MFVVLTLITRLRAGPGTRGSAALATGCVVLLSGLALLSCGGGGATSAAGASPPATAMATATATATATPPVDVAHGQWSQGARMGVARSETAAAVLDGLIYVPGGFAAGQVVAQVPQKVLEAYDPAANRWQRLADMLQPRQHLMTTAYGGRIYVFGGAASSYNWVPTNTAWAYDPTTNTWSSVAPIPEARLAGAAVTLGDALYVLGGVGGSQALLRYDPQANTWTTLAASQVRREHLAAAALDGQIYTMGGRWEGEGECTSVEVYDPATKRWTLTTPLHVAHTGCSAAVLFGQIVVAGGESFSSTPPRALQTVEVYDPATKTWQVATPMPVGLHGNLVASVGGKVYVLGGSDQPGAIVNVGRVLIYSVG